MRSAFRARSKPSSKLLQHVQRSGVNRERSIDVRVAKIPHDVTVSAEEIRL